MSARDTIAAVATPPGAGGVGIVRISGPKAREIAHAICGELAPRRASHRVFRDAHGDAIDDGIALWFPAPHSYTGEDVVELQAHGSPVLLAALLARVCALGARPARPGEFTERAFLEGRLDLAQAEAVADLITAGSEAAARAARRSLDGVFSRRADALAEAVIALRMYVEAAIDFPEEEIDFLADDTLLRRLDAIRDELAALQREAHRGARLVDGLHVVIVGPPNAGKSSLLNALAGGDRAIVTDIAGTTRDLLRERISLDDVTLTLVDTAGLRDSDEPVEREGIRRARTELARADLALAVLDARDADAQRTTLAADVAAIPQVLWIRNKVDLVGGEPHAENDDIALSAKTGAGIELLIAAIRRIAHEGAPPEGAFTARARHLEALSRAAARLDAAHDRLATDRAGELAAEELRLAHDALGEITGRIDADALLGRIFASFCIGK